MALNQEQLQQLLKMIQQTRDIELTCSECLDDLDKYAQSKLDGTTIAGALEHVKAHLEACPPCADQLKMVLDTLQAIEEP